MNRGILSLLVVCGIVLCFAFQAEGVKRKWHQLEGYTFEQYVKDHGKRYETKEEFLMRKEIFKTKLASVLEHNSQGHLSWKKGVNHFTDRTEEELRRVLGVKKSLLHAQVAKRTTAKNLAVPAGTVLPDSIDWRTKNIISPVKDQGQCGSCWTFGTAQSVESYYALATGLLPILSEQQILDCTPNPSDCGGTGGCDGGTTELAYTQIAKTGGLASEWTYPYASYWGANFPTCSWSNSSTPPVAQVDGFNPLPSNQYSPIIVALATIGPLAVSVDASAWYEYEEGVFTGCNVTNPDIDHAVQLVGYGIDPVFGSYWLIRNSWSPSWGEAGYIRIARSSTPTCGVDINPADGDGCSGGPSTVAVCGECAILYDANYPLISTM